MEEILEINGKEYTFTANRRTLSIIAKLQQKDDENTIDDMFYALLKPAHNLSMQEVSELLDKAVEEYGIKQLMEFAQLMINEVFTSEGKEKKQIPLLARNKKA